MGKIEDARQALAEIEREIEDMRRQARDHRHEHARLARSTDPADIQRAAALEEAASRLEQQIPERNWTPEKPAGGELHWRWHRAKVHLQQLREQRHALVRRIAELESQAAAWGDTLKEAERLLLRLAEIFSRAGEYPAGWNDRDLRGKAIWARQRQQELAGLAELRARLDDFGEDDYTPPEEQWTHRVDRGFQAAAGGRP